MPKVNKQDLDAVKTKSGRAAGGPVMQSLCNNRSVLSKGSLVAGKPDLHVLGPTRYVFFITACQKTIKTEKLPGNTPKAFLLDKRSVMRRDVPVQLQAYHESRSHAKALPDLCVGAIEDVEQNVESKQKESALGKLVDIAVDVRFDLLATFPSKLPASQAGVHEERGDGAYGRCLSRWKSVFLRSGTVS
jgi:hypothetical protein